MSLLNRAVKAAAQASLAPIAPAPAQPAGEGEGATGDAGDAGATGEAGATVEASTAGEAGEAATAVPVARPGVGARAGEWARGALRRGVALVVHRGFAPRFAHWDRVQDGVGPEAGIRLLHGFEVAHPVLLQASLEISHWRRIPLSRLFFVEIG